VRIYTEINQDLSQLEVLVINDNGDGTTLKSCYPLPIPIDITSVQLCLKHIDNILNDVR